MRSPRGLFRLTAVLAAAGALLACQGEEVGDRQGHAIVDSSGVRIVHSVSPAWDETSAWVLDTVPIVSLGLADGADEYVFTTVRGVVALPDGRIVVADWPSNELRVFDASGAFLYRFGGEGEGPGEFEYLRSVQLCLDDRVFGFGIAWPVSVFDYDGSFMESYTLELPESFGGRRPYGVSCNGRGDFLVRAWPALDAMPESAGPYETEAPMGWVLDDGSYIDFGVFSGGTRFRFERTGTAPYPGGSSTLMVAHGERAFVAESDDFDIGVFDTSGAQTGIFRRDPAFVPFDPGFIERKLRADAEAAGFDPEMAVGEAAEISGFPLPETFPAYADMLVSREGDVWVEEFTPSSTAPRQWSVFSPGGVWLGNVSVPHNARLQFVAEDRVYAVARNAFDIETVVVFRLRKP